MLRIARPKDQARAHISGLAVRESPTLNVRPVDKLESVARKKSASPPRSWVMLANPAAMGNLTLPALLLCK